MASVAPAVCSLACIDRGTSRQLNVDTVPVIGENQPSLKTEQQRCRRDIWGEVLLILDIRKIKSLYNLAYPFISSEAHNVLRTTTECVVHQTFHASRSPADGAYHDWRSRGAASQQRAAWNAVASGTRVYTAAAVFVWCSTGAGTEPAEVAAQRALIRAVYGERTPATLCHAGDVVNERRSATGRCARRRRGPGCHLPKEVGVFIP